MADKKISQLPLSGGINTSDISVLVDALTTEQYSFAQLLTYLSANFSVGDILTFGTGAIPSNAVGKDGDVYVKTDTGQFAQKLSGVWAVVYTIVNGVVGSTIYYGSTVPNNGAGIDGDTYLRTSNGAFYKKVSGVWVLQFTMATGPAGAPGATGANGVDGINGNSVRYGTSNPSNSLDGFNGDFFINTTTLFIFGPKVGGIWPAGTSISGPVGPSGNVFTIAKTETDLLEDGAGSGNWYLPFLDILGNPVTTGGLFSVAIISNAPAIGPENFNPNFSPPRIYGFADNSAKSITVAVLFGSGVSPVAPGVGIPAGGTTGQSLVKLSNTDYNAGWVTVSGSGGISGSGLTASNFVFNAAFTGIINSINTVFTMPDTPVANTIRVFLRGMRLKTGVAVVGAVVTLTAVPQTGDDLVFDYIK